jgi:aldehyde dehydrogenase (NAD+)
MARELTLRPGIESPDFGPNMGTMVSHAQRDRAHAMVLQARDQGAGLICGGETPDLPGAFLQPTLLDVAPDNVLAQQEAFAPVLSVLTFDQDDEAISIANGTDYGLVGGVFTRDIDRATRAARDMRAGQVFINEWYAGGVETPFGGYGKSGYGREKGREALWNYVQTKNIAIRLRG